MSRCMEAGTSGCVCLFVCFWAIGELHVEFCDWGDWKWGPFWVWGCVPHSSSESGWSQRCPFFRLTVIFHNVQRRLLLREGIRFVPVIRSTYCYSLIGFYNYILNQKKIFCIKLTTIKLSVASFDCCRSQ